MQISFMLEDYETAVTPMSTAGALINDSRFNVFELQEIAEYINVYTRHRLNNICAPVRQDWEED